MTEIDPGARLDEQGLAAFIVARYRNPGDMLFRMERLPWYDVASQNADRDAFLAGRAPDWSRKQAWLDELAADARHGLIARRVRVLSATLTVDELMSCHYGYPFTGRYEQIRVLHTGEHPPAAGLLDHDYWVITAYDRPAEVVRMHYSRGGAFQHASVVAPDAIGPYLREQATAWAVAEPFTDWWNRHHELHHTLAA